MPTFKENWYILKVWKYQLVKQIYPPAPQDNNFGNGYVVLPECCAISCSHFQGQIKRWCFLLCRLIFRVPTNLESCILKEGSPGMIVVLSTLFVHAGVTPPVNGIEQICRCPDDKSNAPNLCHKLQRLLNYAIYNKMTCMLHHHMLAVTIP